MIKDPVMELSRVVASWLSNTKGIVTIQDYEISEDTNWRPHLWDAESKTAWYLLTSIPSSDSWKNRLLDAKKSALDLNIGICAPIHVLQEESVLLDVFEINGAILLAKENENSYEIIKHRDSIVDVVYEERWKLQHPIAQKILEGILIQSLKNRDSYEKGALLELLVALLLSQVDGFEITETNILSASQEVDINVINRNVSGMLGRGGLVLAEAKNWSNPVDRKEYNAFTAKIRTKRGLAKLGIMVTTGTFTEAVYIEHIGERDKDDLVVLIDGKSLPKVWRDYPSITSGIERCVTVAAYDHAPQVTPRKNTRGRVRKH